MNEVPPPSRCKRIVAAVCLALVFGVASPARAAPGGPETPPISRTLPLPAPGMERLIRIGPQALIREDDQGRLTMVDEATVPSPKAKSGLLTATAMLGLIGLGAFLSFDGPYTAAIGTERTTPAR